VLVNGFDAWLETAAGRYPLSTQCYAPDVLAPTGWTAIEAFTNEPWPTWSFALEDGTRVVQELFAVHGAPIVVVGWRLEQAKGAKKRQRAKSDVARLVVRPFLSGRDHHSLHLENDAFRFHDEVVSARAGESRVKWRPYDSVPAVASLANATWRSDPHWYRGFRAVEDAARGFDDLEALASPGTLEFDLASGPAWWVVAQELTVARRGRGGKVTKELVSPLDGKLRAAAFAEEARDEELARRAKFPSPRARAASQYLVVRGQGKSLIAGYPWFTDWGRDTAIAVRGLCIATGERADARDVLLEWGRSIEHGLLPNRFPDHGAPAEFGAADAALWFVVAVEELLTEDARARKSKRVVDKKSAARLLEASLAIVRGYADGTRHGIRVEGDGLLAVGEPSDSHRAGVAATWMDARVDGSAITPRVGKPVELQALWWNALGFAARELPDGARWKKLASRAQRSFVARFWDDDDGCLYDVVDVDHVAGTKDASFRPNQLFAIGGLPRALIAGARARRIADVVAVRLWTPRGVRTLAPDDPRSWPRCEGGPSDRDTAYHQGSAWTWLLHPLVDAWARSRGDTKAARKSARERFLQPLLDELATSATPHAPELADSEAPHAWRGCPMQAWSLGAVLAACEKDRAVR
jgi:predicted glycogen debranching enzyme